MFEVKDIMTIVLALYGAVLSSILAVREVKKEKRYVQLFLDYYEFETGYKLVLVNIGYRPVTIVGCGIRELYKNGKPIEAMPLNFSQFEKDLFPFVLKDGEHKDIVVHYPFDAPYKLKSKKQKLEAYARDAEGRIFKTSEIRSFSTRIDSYV